MKSLVLFTVLVLANVSFGQRIKSNCVANDSITNIYRNDADRLTLKRFYRNDSKFADSINIPNPISDTVLKALIAVYNVKSIPARDTVIDQFGIHTFNDFSINRFQLDADSNLGWVKNLVKGKIPCGNTHIDSLIIPYNFKVESYGKSFPQSAYKIVMRSDSNYNIEELTKRLKRVPDVISVRSLISYGDGNRILDSIYTDHIELIYSYGWGDCQAGCINRRYWKFKVYYDCSVEFVNSYGKRLGTKQTFQDHLSINPNPFTDQLRLNGLTENVNYSIYNQLGIKYLEGTTNTGIIDNLGSLKSGVYYLERTNQDKVGTFKIIKL